MEELTEVITAAEFHPRHCNLMMYSTSKGTIKLNDLRENALCDTTGLGLLLFFLGGGAITWRFFLCGQWLNDLSLFSLPFFLFSSSF